MPDDGRIVRDGKVAVKYFQQVGQVVKIGQDAYRFDVKLNICMAWVKEEHVNQVLNITKICCGGNKRKPYRLANELDVKRWMGEGMW
jgi:hypothetical protein